MSAIEQIWISEVACLPTNKEHLPSDSRSRTEWHSFLIKVLQKITLLSLLDQKQLYIRTLPIEPATFLLEDGTAGDDDVGVVNNNSNNIDSIVFPAERRIHQELVRGQATIKAGAVWGSFSRTIKMTWNDRSVRVNAIPLLLGLLLDMHTRSVCYSWYWVQFEAGYLWKDVSIEFHNKIKLGSSKNKELMIRKSGSIMVARPFNYSYCFIYQEWKSLGLCIMHVLFVGTYYGRQNQ